MKTITKSIYALATVAILASCAKDDVTQTTNPSFADVDNFEELKVPNSFNFSTTRTISYDLNMAEAPTNAKYRVDFYNFLPEAGGELIQSTYALGQSVATGEVTVPSYTTNLYVKVNAPDGSSALYVIDGKSNSTSANLFTGKKSTKTGAPVSPDCNTGCDESYNNHSNNMNINSNDPGGIYCLKGNHTGNINVNRSGVTIRICGNAVISNLNLNQGSSLEIASGGSLRVTNLGVNSSNGTILVHVNATLELTNNYSSQAQVTNYGTITVQSNYNLNSQGSLTNNGFVSIGVDLNQNGTFVNNNHVLVGDDFMMNGNSSNTNNCKLIIMDDLHGNGTFINDSYTFVGDELIANGGFDCTLRNGAMIVANRATINTKIKGSGSTSIVKLETTNAPTSSNALDTRINGGAGFEGNIEFCDPNGIETNNGSFTNGAAEGCNLYVPTSACNPKGNGTPTIIDTDGDGAADNVDEYPTDPARASNDYFPSQNTFGTLAYEDLWPALGDYDFNDLVVDYNYTIVKNAGNDVVDVKAKYVVRAIGGAYKNGFGIQFGVPSATVASVTGQTINGNLVTNGANGAESGQTKATVIVFTDASDILANFGTEFTNTVQGEAFSTPDTTNIVVNFGTPQTLAAIGIAPFNPFLIANANRGREVHLPGNAPTSLADQQLFGTGDDATNGSNKLYQSPGNLPWALNIATGFDYPKERVDIVTVYSNFASWAQSGGSQNADWYVNNPGNIVTGNVFQAP